MTVTNFYLQLFFNPPAQKVNYCHFPLPGVVFEFSLWLLLQHLNVGGVGEKYPTRLCPPGRLRSRSSPAAAGAAARHQDELGYLDPPPAAALVAVEDVGQVDRVGQQEQQVGGKRHEEHLEICRTQAQ